MTVFGLTDKGVVRQKNEDSFYFGKIGEVLVCIVCDGMGGARCGELASSLAISAFLEKLDSIKLQPYKEEGQQIRAAAAAAGKSLQGYILEAVREKMEREK